MATIAEGALSATSDRELFEGAYIVEKDVHQPEFFTEPDEQEEPAGVQRYAVGLLLELFAQVQDIGLIVPHSDCLVSGAGGDERFSYADVHTSDLPLMKRVGQVIKTGTGATLPNAGVGQRQAVDLLCGGGAYDTLL